MAICQSRSCPSCGCVMVFAPDHAASCHSPNLDYASDAQFRVELIKELREHFARLEERIAELEAEQARRGPF